MKNMPAKGLCEGYCWHPESGQCPTPRDPVAVLPDGPTSNSSFHSSQQGWEPYFAVSPSTQPHNVPGQLNSQEKKAGSSTASTILIPHITHQPRAGRGPKPTSITTQTDHLLGLRHLHKAFHALTYVVIEQACKFLPPNLQTWTHA